MSLSLKQIEDTFDIRTGAYKIVYVPKKRNGWVYITFKSKNKRNKAIQEQEYTHTLSGIFPNIIADAIPTDEKDKPYLARIPLVKGEYVYKKPFAILVNDRDPSLYSDMCSIVEILATMGYVYTDNSPGNFGWVNGKFMILDADIKYLYKVQPKYIKYFKQSCKLIALYALFTEYSDPHKVARLLYDQIRIVNSDLHFKLISELIPELTPVQIEHLLKKKAIDLTLGELEHFVSRHKTLMLLSHEELKSQFSIGLDYLLTELLKEKDKDDITRLNIFKDNEDNEVFPRLEFPYERIRFYGPRHLNTTLEYVGLLDDGLYKPLDKKNQKNFLTQNPMTVESRSMNGTRKNGNEPRSRSRSRSRSRNSENGNGSYLGRLFRTIKNRFWR